MLRYHSSHRFGDQMRVSFWRFPQYFFRFDFYYVLDINTYLYIHSIPFRPSPYVCFLLMFFFFFLMSLRRRKFNDKLLILLQTLGTQCVRRDSRREEWTIKKDNDEQKRRKYIYIYFTRARICNSVIIRVRSESSVRMRRRKLCNWSKIKLLRYSHTRTHTQEFRWNWETRQRRRWRRQPHGIEDEKRKWFIRLLYDRHNLHTRIVLISGNSFRVFIWRVCEHERTLNTNDTRNRMIVKQADRVCTIEQMREMGHPKIGLISSYLYQ